MLELDFFVNYTYLAYKSALKPNFNHLNLEFRAQSYGQNTRTGAESMPNWRYKHDIIFELFWTLRWNRILDQGSDKHIKCGFSFWWLKWIQLSCCRQSPFSCKKLKMLQQQQQQRIKHNYQPTRKHNFGD